MARFEPPPGTWQPAPRPQAGQPAPHIPVVGPTRALRGWAGGPGFEVSSGDTPDDPAPVSPWQLAREAWQDAGVSWESPAAEPAESALPPESAFPPAFAAMPLGAPTFADIPAADFREAPRAETPPRFPRSRPPEPDELFREWQGSVRKASGRQRQTARGRRRTWNLIGAGVPVAVIVTVGAGAVMMLTGKTNGMLADHAKQASPPPGAKGAALTVGGSATLTRSMFSGYPGQHGAVLVSSTASAGGTRLAVGSADGHPAIWRRAANGEWTLVSATSPAVFQRPGIERLTSIAHGPAGWLAVGGVVSGAAQQPVVLTSADGVTWRALDRMAAFAGPDSYVMGVTAGPDGYVIVGKQMSRGRTFAAMWWSADLRSWIMGGNGGLDGRLESSTVYAVTALPAGFIAAGTHGHCHSLWTSQDGRQWKVRDIVVPNGATSAMLNLLAVNGSRVVAAGYAVLRTGHIPIVVISMDGGRHWYQMVLGAPGTFGAVTALTASGSGFVAAGVAGPAGAQRSVTWHSPDGLRWSPATQAGLGTRQITALYATGRGVTATVQQGADPYTVTLPAR